MERRATARSLAITPITALAVLAGVLAVQALPVLPPLRLDLALAAVALWLLRYPRWRWIAIIALAFVWAALRGQWALDA